MTYSFTKKRISLAVSCALALGFAGGAAHADTSVPTNPANTGFVVDERGGVARSGFGLCWHSGTGPAPASSECNPKPAPTPVANVVQEPAPPVAAAPPPAPRAVERVTLDADTLFDFDKSELRPAGREALDRFVEKFGEIQPDMITAIGHTDRIGSEAYNQHLSEQRVATVKAYLIGKGVDPNRIHTEGRGEMQPATAAGECGGTTSAKLIACLQPDRRVEVEVIGARMATR